ncbi:hypothetical protein [Caballeronia sp. BR00000012568055]|uniref:hypothetical protein n=1 Tax=Caballeronia sp. BR00000012568055 TaxID=2918761 RepID=UPI0023F8B36C|nr:hypothetical protein [Caballeronia sp. BR00000012568055]
MSKTTINEQTNPAARLTIFFSTPDPISDSAMFSCRWANEKNEFQPENIRAYVAWTTKAKTLYCMFVTRLGQNALPRFERPESEYSGMTKHGISLLIDCFRFFGGAKNNTIFRRIFRHYEGKATVRCRAYVAIRVMILFVVLERGDVL